MKYLWLIAAVAIVYFVLARQAPVTAVQQSVSQAEVAPLTSGSREVPPAKTAFKQPFDRTHEALHAVEKRNGTGEF
jgi:hypothetical protein